MKLLKKILIVLLVLIVVAYVGISYMLSNRVLTPNSSFEKTVTDMPVYWNTTFEAMMALLPEPEDVSIEGYEGIALQGKYFDVAEEDKCLFIFVHGWGTTWANMLKYYPMVDECGCDVLMYDHRAHGGSGGEYPTGSIKEAEDLLLVTQWANESKGFEWNQIAWLGSSWGAAASLTAGAKGNDPAFIVADASFQDWFSAVFERAIRDYGAGIKAIAPGVMQVVNMRAGVNYKEASPKEKAKDITEPVLLIHSQGDLETSSDQSVNISKNLNAQSEFHHTQWGNDHVKDVLHNTSEMKTLLMNFIDRNAIAAFQPALSVADTLVVDTPGGN